MKRKKRSPKCRWYDSSRSCQEPGKYTTTTMVISSSKKLEAELSGKRYKPHYIRERMCMTHYMEAHFGLWPHQCSKGCGHGLTPDVFWIPIEVGMVLGTVKGQKVWKHRMFCPVCKSPLKAGTGKSSIKKQDDLAPFKKRDDLDKMIAKREVHNPGYTKAVQKATSERKVKRRRARIAR